MLADLSRAFRFGYNNDPTVSPLRSKGSGGSHEVSLAYTVAKKKKGGNKKLRNIFPIRGAEDGEKTGADHGYGLMFENSSP